MPEPHTTQHGTPCANTWTPDWIAVVEAREESLERPICGARLMLGGVARVRGVKSLALLEIPAFAGMTKGRDP